MKYFRQLLSLFVVATMLSSFKGGTANLPDEIPKEDREKIESFLSFLFWDQTFAFVPFGSKPMSVISQIFKNIPPEEWKGHPAFNLKSLWEVWKRYEGQLNERFAFFSLENPEYFQIMLIDKPQFLKVVSHNLSLFQEKIGEALSPEEILERMFDTTSVVDEVFKGSRALYGLLLGYGRKNALGFDRHYFIDKPRLRFPRPKASSEIVPFEENRMIVPCFVSFCERESRRILLRYCREREEIEKRIAEGNFLEQVIQELYR